MQKLKDIESTIDWLSKKFTTKKGLVAIIILYLMSWYSLSKIEVDFFSSVLVQNILIALLFIIVVFWWFKRNQEKLSLGKEIKIAIAFQTDEVVNFETIEAFLYPVLEKLRRNSNLKNISFIKLLPNEILSSKDAEVYVNTNHFSIDKLLWFRFEIGLQDHRNILSVKEVSFAYKNIPSQVYFQGVKIDIGNELAFGAFNTEFGIFQIDQLNDKERLKKSLNQIILYALGVCCVFQMRFGDSLSVLKEIYNPNDSTLTPQRDDKKKNLVFEIGKPNLLSARLRDLLANIYLNLIFEYHKKGDIKAVYNICLEAQEKLGEIKAAYWVYVQLARLSYEMGRLDDAKIFTAKMRRIEDKDTDEVIINMAFFSIIDNNIDEVVNWYKKLSVDGVTFGVVDVINFLNQYEPETVVQLNLRDYATALLTYLYIDSEAGKIMIKEIKKRIDRNKKFSPVIVHLNDILKIKIKKTA